MIEKCENSGAILIMSLLFGRYTHTWQGMSYADIAGLPFVAGLYADFSPLIIYAFFGSSRQIAVGPVAIISLLVYQSIPLCNKLCAESNGVNATVTVRFKRKIYTTMTETLPRSLSSLYPLSLLSDRVCVSDDTYQHRNKRRAYILSDNIYILHTDSCSLWKVSKQMHCYANARLQPWGTMAVVVKAWSGALTDATSAGHSSSSANVSSADVSWMSLSIGPSPLALRFWWAL